MARIRAKNHTFSIVFKTRGTFLDSSRDRFSCVEVRSWNHYARSVPWRLFTWRQLGRAPGRGAQRNRQGGVMEEVVAGGSLEGWLGVRGRTQLAARPTRRLDPATFISILENVMFLSLFRNFALNSAELNHIRRSLSSLLVFQGQIKGEERAHGGGTLGESKGDWDGV